MNKTMTNYEKMAENGRILFLKYDRGTIAGKYGSEYDENYLFIRFFGCRYRIARDSGIVEKAKKDVWLPTAPEEALILYDIFCYGKPDAFPAGEFVNQNSLILNVSASASPGTGLFGSQVRRLEGNTERIKKGCEALGGSEAGKGDAAYEFSLFDFLKIRFQFWDADEEFPASIAFYMDANMLDYMHFETTWYVSSFVLERILESSGLERNDPFSAIHPKKIFPE